MDTKSSSRPRPAPGRRKQRVLMDSGDSEGEVELSQLCASA